MAEAADPVRAFLDAHQRGRPVALRTSGSTGTARSVVRTTDSWVDSFPHVSALTGIGPGSRVWVPGPLTASMNLFAAAHATFAGATLVAGADRATHAVLTPAALDGLLAAGPPDWLTVVVAGDRLPARLGHQAEDAGMVVHHYYGAAELSFVAWGRDEESLHAFPGAEVEVRDGEVWVRSPYLCAGYAGPPGPLRRDADGFATVGDRGTLADGRLVVTGRPGAVTTAGSTVHLADVESVLAPLATGDVVVLGLPHPRLGDVLAVALTDPADHPRLLARARDRLDGGHRPRLWFAVPSLPRTEAGKLDRDALAVLLHDPAGPARRLT